MMLNNNHQTTTTRLLLGGMVLLIVLNYFTFHNVNRHSRETSADPKKFVTDVLEMQLERREDRIRELEKQVSIAKGGGKTRGSGHSDSTALAPLPPQVLQVGWQWEGRQTRRVRFFDGNEVMVYKTTYEGSMAKPDNPTVDWWDAVEIRAWEIETFFVYKTFLGPQSSFIDFGAWIGPTVLYGASLAKRAYALEPDPYAFDELRANVALNPKLQDHSYIYWKCIMDKPGIYPMGGGGGDSMASVGAVNQNDKSWKVDCMTLPQFIENNRIENLDLIKMDPEGAEHIILPAFKSWLMQQEVKPTLWLSIHKWKYGRGGAAAVIDVLRLYKRVHEGHLDPIDLDNYDLCSFCTILATDRDVKIYHE